MLIQRGRVQTVATLLLVGWLVAGADTDVRADDVTVPLTWWSSRTEAVNVYEPLPEQVRLGAATTGYVEGLIQLPADTQWDLRFYINPD